jgi:PKD repeat protein
VSGPIFYNWQFGDGFFSNFPNTSHEYAQAGVYEVTLTATGNNVGVNGCVDQETREIRVYEPPLANSTTTDACIGAAVNLVDVSLWRVIEGTTDPVISRQWNILDGPTGNQEGFIGMDSVQTFIPAAAGTFDVGLELETAAGCQASSTGSFLVQAIPSADFDLTLPEINPPFTSVPDNLSEDGINFEWLINGELVSTEFEPSLTFDSAGDYEVVLVATNDLNCNDSAMAMFTVILPEYDIALIELQYQTQGTTLVLNAIISNNGNVVVETFDTEIEVGRDIQFTVVSDFTLLPGVLVDYPLGSDIGYIPGRDLPYTCMRISNPNGQTETDTTNNYLCIGLNEQRATFGDPYPNPAKDEVKLTFVLPDDGPLSVEITGSDGRLMESFVLDLKEGLNTVDYPLIGWSEGMYFLKFSYRNQEEVFRLVVAR